MVGVPDSTPVTGSRVSPGGNVPLETRKVAGSGVAVGVRGGVGVGVGGPRAGEAVPGVSGGEHRRWGV